MTPGWTSPLASISSSRLVLARSMDAYKLKHDWEG